MSAGVLFDLGGRVFHAPRPFVGTGRGQGVEHIANGGDAANQGNVAALEAIRIARAVPFLVMGQGDDSRRLHQIGIMAGKDAGADNRMGFHDSPFRCIQFRRL